MSFFLHSNYIGYASLTNSVWFYISKRIGNRIKGSNSSNASLPEYHKLAAVGYN